MNVADEILEDRASAAQRKFMGKGAVNPRLMPRQTLLETLVAELLQSEEVKSNTPDTPINVSDLPPAPLTAREAFETSNPRRYNWMGATQAEMKSHADMGTFEMVPNSGNFGNIIGSKLVFAHKIDESGKVLRFKARLVATGWSQKEGVDFFETFAPVGRIQSIRFLVALALYLGLQLEQMDVATAFLYALLDEPNYMRLPPGFRQFDTDGRELVCRLIRAIYGLHQSSRAWFKNVKDHLLSKGFVQSLVDPCLFFQVDSVNLKLLIVIVYVDDMILTANSAELMSELKQIFKDQYEMKDLGDAKYLLGIQIERRNGGVWMGQPRYTQDFLKEAQMWTDAAGKETTSKPTPMSALWKHDPDAESLDAESHSLYRSNLMKASYLAQQTRPDIVYTVNVLAEHQQAPNKSDELALERLMRYLRGTWDVGLFFCMDGANIPKLFGPAGEETIGDLLVGYADASYAEDTRRHSRGAFVFMLGGATVNWFTKRQSTIALSSTEAEYYALAEATKEAIWWRNLFDELHIAPTKPTLIHQDNQSTIALAKNPVHHQKNKHYDIKAHFLRSYVENQSIRLEYCPTGDMIADALTKALPPALHKRFTDCMGLKSLSSL